MGQGTRLAPCRAGSELCLVARLRAAGGQLVTAAALPALGAAGYVGQGVRADEIPVGRCEDPGCHPLPREASKPGWLGQTPSGGHSGLTQRVETSRHLRYLHDVVGFQSRVGRGVDEDIGEGVLMIVHLICKGDRAPGGGHHSAPAHLCSARSGGARGARPAVNLTSLCGYFCPSTLSSTTRPDLVPHDRHLPPAPSLHGRATPQGACSAPAASVSGCVSPEQSHRAYLCTPASSETCAPRVPAPWNAPNPVPSRTLCPCAGQATRCFICSPLCFGFMPSVSQNL